MGTARRAEYIYIAFFYVSFMTPKFAIFFFFGRKSFMQILILFVDFGRHANHEQIRL